MSVRSDFVIAVLIRTQTSFLLTFSLYSCVTVFSEICVQHSPVMGDRRSLDVVCTFF